MDKQAILAAYLKKPSKKKSPAFRYEKKIVCRYSKNGLKLFFRVKKFTYADLAQKMSSLIRQRLNMSEIARKAFPIEPLPPGALPVYTKKPEYTMDLIKSGSPGVEPMYLGTFKRVPSDG